MEYTCPFCDYTDTARESVEAHISGSSNSLHVGKVGRMYRSEIEEEAEPETIRERVLSNGPAHARQSELDDLREQTQAVAELTEDLAERVEELEEVAGDLTERVESLEKQTSDIEERQEEIGATVSTVGELTERVHSTEEAIKNIDAVVSDRRRLELSCPECFEMNTLDTSEGGELFCRQCGLRPVAGQID
jgi:DNA repair exonuclease SbcCD ATPase subunit